jgi:hypothetical protein
MNGRAYMFLALACAACRITPHGEWNAAECSDGVDNDGDGRVDCDDPDCWAFECQPNDAMPTDAGHDAGSAPQDAATPDAKAPDAAPPPKPVDDADAAPIADDDAGDPEAPNCTRALDLCQANEICVAGVCKPQDISGDYTIQILSAALPDRNPAGVCYDPEILLCAAVRDCLGCKPDPYVTVQKTSVIMVGKTLPKNDTETPTWMEAGDKVTLTNTDTLEFTVWDWDPPAQQTKVFSCSPDLRQLPSGMLRCSPPKGATITPAPGQVFEVVARVTKLP